jgi:hypothetical protein
LSSGTNLNSHINKEGAQYSNSPILQNPKNMHNNGNTSYRYNLKKLVQEFGCASKVARKEREG